MQDAASYNIPTPFDLAKAEVVQMEIRSTKERLVELEELLKFYMME
jgi:hypothetical protein